MMDIYLAQSLEEVRAGVSVSPLTPTVLDGYSWRGASCTAYGSFVAASEETLVRTAVRNPVWNTAITAGRYDDRAHVHFCRRRVLAKFGSSSTSS